MSSFIDKYLSTEKDSDAFFGDKSVVITDSATGAALTCANFISSMKQHANDKNSTSSSSYSSSSGMATMTSDSASSASETASSTPTGNDASRTAALGFGAAAGVAGLIALFL